MDWHIKDIAQGLSRRHFIAGAAGAIAFSALPGFVKQAVAAPLELEALPYAENALEPVISANTLSFHYGKHHKGYVDNVNKIIEGTKFVGMPLEKIIAITAGKTDKTALFNNAAQAWNHAFY